MAFVYSQFIYLFGPIGHTVYKIFGQGVSESNPNFIVFSLDIILEAPNSLT